MVGATYGISANDGIGITKIKLEYILSNENNRKTPGSDRIQVKTLKKLKERSIVSFANIIEQSV